MLKGRPHPCCLLYSPSRLRIGYRGRNLRQGRCAKTCRNQVMAAVLKGRSLQSRLIGQPKLRDDPHRLAVSFRSPFSGIIGHLVASLLENNVTAMHEHRFHRHLGHRCGGEGRKLTSSRRAWRRGQSTSKNFEARILKFAFWASTEGKCGNLGRKRCKSKLSLRYVVLGTRLIQREQKMRK